MSKENYECIISQRGIFLCKKILELQSDGWYN